MQMNDSERRCVLQHLCEVTVLVQQIAVCGEVTCNGMDELVANMDAHMNALRKILSSPGEAEQPQSVLSVNKSGEGITELVIHDKMQELGSALDMCMRVLRRRLIDVEKELKATRQSRRALSAYRNNK
jgi:adenine C2-methylase RlmN of 23S rRNA A2503 and tRNA A37